MRTSVSATNGFTLVEILAGTTIFSIIMVLLLSILNSFEATGDSKVTQQRMDDIIKKAKQYYLSRENLPLPTVPGPPVQPAPPGTVADVPIGDFNLNAKSRVDSWGKPFQYFSVRNDGQNGRPGQIIIDPISSGAPAGSPVAMAVIPQSDLTVTPRVEGKTLLQGIQLNGSLVAGILISSGPNNVFEYTQTPGYPETFVLNPAGDDIIMAIDLTPEATQIAQTELKKLGEKVRGFDDRFIGKNNNWNTTYDEDGCTNVRYPGPGISTRIIGDRVYRLGFPNNIPDPNDPAALSPVCSTFPQLPGAGYMPDDGRDYSCGVPTLDFMKANYCNISLGLGNCAQGYYVPNQLQRGYDYIWHPDSDPDDPNDPNDPHTPDDSHWEEILMDCPAPGPYIGADYFRLPMVRGNPQPNDCHWGLVGDPSYIFPTGAPNNELNNEQTRTFLLCVFNLSPDDIVDPWLNGYTWGCAITSGCATGYPQSNPRFHKYFSAGADNTVNTVDDIISPL